MALGSATSGDAVVELVSAVAPGTDEEALAGAAEIVGLLRASMHADASVHGLSVATEPAGAADGGNTTAALRGALLAARANELAAGLGEEPLAQCSVTGAAIVRGWMIETEDLYDAGRPPERCLEAAEKLGGAPARLAAALGGWVAGAAAEKRQALGRFGAELGTAMRIRDDCAALGTEAGREALARGVYSLPVACALQADPSLARALGGAIPSDRLGELGARIRDAGAAAAARRGAARAEAAGAAIGTSAPGAEIADAVRADCEREAAS
jgi:geranylgeranyl pyrophosphate synthase